MSGAKRGRTPTHPPTAAGPSRALLPAAGKRSIWFFRSVFYCLLFLRWWGGGAAFRHDSASGRGEQWHTCQRYAKQTEMKLELACFYYSSLTLGRGATTARGATSVPISMVTGVMSTIMDGMLTGTTQAMMQGINVGASNSQPLVRNGFNQEQVWLTFEIISLPMHADR